MNEPLVTPWTESSSPTESAIRKIYKVENMSPYQWSNGPHDVYSPHVHTFNKVIYVLRGSILFGLPERGRKIHLKTGDRLDLPKGTVHDATVGPDGVVCLEGHRG